MYCACHTLTLLREVRLRLGNKIKNLAFYFVLRSPCTNFAQNQMAFSKNSLFKTKKVYEY